MTFAVLTLTVLLGACARPPQDVSDDLSFGHVHGLAVNPADDRLYVATHDGLFVLDDERVRRVGHDTHDLMGFTSVGPNRYLASGHPSASKTDLPNPLGLVSSNDNGLSFVPVSLGGRADLHAIEQRENQIVAFDSSSSAVLQSDDGGRSFDTLASVEATDLVLTEAGKILATDGASTLSVVDDAGVRPVDSAPPLVLIDGDQTLGGLSPAGLVWSSTDGRKWSRRGNLPGSPQALTVEPDGWFAATSTGLYKSLDKGARWERVL